MEKKTLYLYLSHDVNLYTLNNLFVVLCGSNTLFFYFCLKMSIKCFVSIFLFLNILSLIKSKRIEIEINNYFPYAYKDIITGELKGIEIQLLNLIGQQLNKEMLIKLFDGNVTNQNRM